MGASGHVHPEDSPLPTMLAKAHDAQLTVDPPPKTHWIPRAFSLS
jgi:hypothetical protein